MQIVSIIFDYLSWHYSLAYVDMFGIWRNYLWAVKQQFSVPEVFKSLFSPFKRLQEEKVNIIKKPEEFFANFFVNIIMRIVGFVLRTALLAIALVAFLLVTGLGILTLLLWTVLPLLVVYFFIVGLSYLLL